MGRFFPQTHSTCFAILEHHDTTRIGQYGRYSTTKFKILAEKIFKTSTLKQKSICWFTSKYIDLDLDQPKVDSTLGLCVHSCLAPNIGVKGAQANAILHLCNGLRSLTGRCRRRARIETHFGAIAAFSLLLHLRCRH